jgi:hypothetical protein
LWKVCRAEGGKKVLKVNAGKKVRDKQVFQLKKLADSDELNGTLGI